jgi:hypothetical protein
MLLTVPLFRSEEQRPILLDVACRTAFRRSKAMPENLEAARRTPCSRAQHSTDGAHHSCEPALSSSSEQGWMARRSPELRSPSDGRSAARLSVENNLACSHILRMANSKRSASRPLRATTPRKTAKPKTPAEPAPAYVSDYAVGDHISHPIFGDGTVTAIDQNKLTVEFPDSVTKQILDGYVKRRRA